MATFKLKSFNKEITIVLILSIFVFAACTFMIPYRVGLRVVVVEGVFAALKNWHNFKRHRKRGHKSSC